MVEGLAARWAIEKSHQRLVTELERNIALAEEKVRSGEIKSFVDLDAQFHEIISRLSGSKRLLEFGQTLRRHMLRYRIQSIYLTDNVLRAIRGHKGILRAIKRGNPEEIHQAIKEHLEQSKKDIPGGDHEKDLFCFFRFVIDHRNWGS
ncbi:MAG: GntR family transcriptional regulator [Thermodesulfobacteriota bacterium]